MGGDRNAVGPPCRSGCRWKVHAVKSSLASHLVGGAGEGDVVDGRVFHAEAFEEGADDVGLQNAGNEVGIEAFGLVGVADDEDFFLIGAFDITTGIAGEQIGKGAGERRGLEASGKLLQWRRGLGSFFCVSTTN